MPCAHLHQVALCEQLLQEVWAGPAAVIVNSEFASIPSSSLSAELQPFLASLKTVWSFQPVAVKGLLVSPGCSLLPLWLHPVSTLS